MPTQTGNAAIDCARCIELLAGKQVGRIAWRAADGVQLLPVTYSWYHDCVVFRTSPYGVLSELVRETDVAFEIDHLDEDARSGWSVVVRGRAAAMAEPEELSRLWRVDTPVPWASGTRNLFIRISPALITGRMFGCQSDCES